MSFSGLERMSAISIMLGGGLILGAIGPFGDYYRLGLFARIGLWLIYSIIGSVLFIGSFKLSRALSPRLRAAPVPAQIALVCLFAALPMFVAVEAVGLTLGRPLPTEALVVLESWLEIAVIGAVMLAFFYFMSASPQRNEEPPQAATLIDGRVANLPKELQHELGEAFGDSLFCVKAEGHYARAFGQSGDRMIGISLSKVITLLKDADGALVHRSWWVARNAVDKKRSKNGKVEITLINGVRVPVARRRFKELRSQDWLV